MLKGILLIEDNPDHAELIRSALEGTPDLPPIRVIADGEQALRFVRGGSPEPPLPALVLLDLKLPKVGGLDVLRAMRAAPAWRAVPVVVLTTSTRQADIEACLASGATSYVSKVSGPDGLASSVRDIVARWLRPRA